MKRLNSKYLPIVAFLGVLTISFAIALPLINVNVQQIGEGSNEVIAPVNNSFVNWVVNTSDPRYVTGVIITADHNLTVGSTVYVTLLDSNNNVITTASVTLTTNVTAGTPLPQINFTQEVPINTIYRVAITATGPKV